uniref:Uncharacterized protein n=1 Tax=Arundo donax TaxID=35708 RepID=A0A0A9EK23_ARUDO
MLITSHGFNFKSTTSILCVQSTSYSES